MKRVFTGFGLGVLLFLTMAAIGTDQTSNTAAVMQPARTTNGVTVAFGTMWEPDYRMTGMIVRIGGDTGIVRVHCIYDDTGTYFNVPITTVGQYVGCLFDRVDSSKSTALLDSITFIRYPR